MKRNILGTVTYYLEDRDLEFSVDYDLEDLIAYLKKDYIDFRPHQNGQFEIQCEIIDQLVDCGLIDLESIEEEDEFKEFCWERHEWEYDF